MIPTKVYYTPLHLSKDGRLGGLTLEDFKFTTSETLAEFIPLFVNVRDHFKTDFFCFFPSVPCPGRDWTDCQKPVPAGPVAICQNPGLACLVWCQDFDLVVPLSLFPRTLKDKTTGQENPVGNNTEGPHLTRILGL